MDFPDLQNFSQKVEKTSNINPFLIIARAKINKDGIFKK
jgi:hypothetical protein